MNKSGVFTGVTVSTMIAVLPFLAPSTVLAATPFNSQYQNNANQESSLLQTAENTSASTNTYSSEISALKNTVTTLNSQISTLYSAEQTLANQKTTVPKQIPWNWTNPHSSSNNQGDNGQQGDNEQQGDQNDHGDHWHGPGKHIGPPWFAHANKNWKALSALFGHMMPGPKQDMTKPYNDGLTSLQHTILKLQTTSMQYTKAWIALEQASSSSTSTSTSSLSAPTNLNFSDVSSTGFKVSWSGVSGASGYNVYLNGTRVGSTTGASTSATSYTFTSEQPNTTYHITVQAVNNQGQVGAQSSTASVTTSPFDVNATNQTTTGFTVNWPTVNGAHVYDVHVVNGQNDPVETVYGVTGNSHVMSGLSANTSYTVYVTAMSSSNQQMAKSNSLNVSTLN